METTDDLVKDFLLVAHLVEQLWPLEAIFLVNKLPDVRTVVVGEGLDVLVDIKILASIVGFILNVPDPSVFAIPALVGP